VRAELPASLLCAALDDAAAEGYTIVSFSGGEPLLYRSLPALLDHAHACGLATTVTSNGMPLTDRTIERLRGRVDLLAISLDGVPASHDRMRARPGAFETMARRLPSLRRSGIPFGFIFTLTLHNVDELNWVARFAAESGAALLQVHPLEVAGRARDELPGAGPDETESLFAQLEASRLRREHEGMAIQVDIATPRMLAAAPERVFAGTRPDAMELARLLSPLIVETDGTVVPLSYGFPRRFALGNLHDAPLCRLAARWREAGLPEFRAVCRGTFDELTAEGAPRFANWYERVGQRAQDQPVQMTAA
jgi:Fe-coproporphyrin III synthase